MLRKVSDETIELLRKEIENLNIKGEIKESDIDKIFEYFERKEIEFSTKESNGEIIDVQEFKMVCAAADEFFLDADSEDCIDLKDLNKRL